MRLSVDMVARRQAPPSGCPGTMPSEISNRDAGAAGDEIRTHIETLLAPISQRYILYYPVLQQVTGSAKAALMLSQMLYWTRKYIGERPERDGWFWHTGRDWRKSTGLSRYEQDAARSYLRQCACVEERLMGAPARMHYRVDLDALGKAIAQYAHRTFSAWHWSDRTTLALLGRPVAFLRGFADLTGSVTAALYLSDLCQKQRTAERDAIKGHCTLNGSQRELDAGDGWLDLPLVQSAEHLGISEKRLRTARNIIKTLGILDETTSGGVQPSTLSRINMAQLAKALAARQRRVVPGADTEAPRAAHTSTEVIRSVPGAINAARRQQAFDFSGMAESYIPDIPKPANWNGGNVHSRPAETSKLDIPKPANKLAGFGTSVNEVSTQIGVHLQPPVLNSTGVTAIEAAGSSGSLVPKGNPALLDVSALVLPDNLHRDMKASAYAMLATLPDLAAAQHVADEWAGQLRQGKVRVPLNYLASLVNRARQGEFVPAAGIDEALRRARQKQNEAALAQARNELPTGMSGSPASPKAKPRTGVPAFFREQLKTFGMNVLAGVEKCAL